VAGVAAGRAPTTRRPLRAGALAVLLLALALAAGCATLGRAGENWREARQDSSGQAPDPATTREAVLQVYAARTVGWRGVLAVHTWVALKPTAAPSYTRYEVIGWGVDRGLSAVRVNRAGPDNHWFGSRPDLLVDLRGDGVDALITRVEAAVATYPHAAEYRTWPGPNSNTFTAFIGREVPEIKLDVPPTAMGKDYLPNGLPVARTPGGAGVQLSLWGLAGVLIGWEEGIELGRLGHP